MAVISVRTEDDFKKKAEAFAQSVGLQLGTLMKALLTNAMRTGKVTLESHPIFNKETRKIVLKEMRNNERGIGYDTFDSMEEAIQSLQADNEIRIVYM